MPLYVPDNINKLKLYLFLTNDNANNLARAIGYSPASITNYINGKRPISRRLARLVCDYTWGALSVEEIMNDNPKKDLVKKGQNVIKTDT